MVDESFQSLQAVLQSQLLQVQVVVLAHLLFQELAAEIHHSPHLHIDTTHFCRPEIGLVCVGMRPYFLPREPTSTIVIAAPPTPPIS